MDDSISVLLLGVIVMVVAAVLVVEHYKREQHRNRQLRWLDTHPMRDWIHHRP